MCMARANVVSWAKANIVSIKDWQALTQDFEHEQMITKILMVRKVPLWVYNVWLCGWLFNVQLAYAGYHRTSLIVVLRHMSGD